MPDDASRTAGALFLAGVATFAGLYCTQPLLPLLADDFDVPAGTATLSVSVTTLALGAGLLVAGPVSEVRGRTGMVRASLLASSLVGLACAAAPTWSALLALRAVQGLALAGLPAVATAYLREEVRGPAYARATGLYVGGTALGGMAGRLLAGGLAELAGWRGAVAGVGLLTLACAGAVVRLLPASRGFVPVPPAVGPLLRTYGRLLADPVLLGLYAVGGLLMGAFVAVYNALAFRLEAAPYGLSVGAAGLVFLVYALGTGGSVIGGRLAGRFGNRPVVPAATAVMGAGILLTLAEPLEVVVVGTAVLTAGFFAAHGVASGWVTARASLGAGGPGQAAALYLLAYYTGSSVVGTAAGSTWAAGGWPAVVALTAALVAAGLAVSLALLRTASLVPASDPPPAAP